MQNRSISDAHLNAQFKGPFTCIYVPVPSIGLSGMAENVLNDSYSELSKQGIFFTNYMYIFFSTK